MKDEYSQCFLHKFSGWEGEGEEEEEEEEEDVDQRFSTEQILFLSSSAAAGL